MSDNNTLFYLHRDGAQTGPFTIGQLRSMWQSGSITAQTQYWFEGAPEWRPLINILRLLEPPAAAVPVAVPVAATPQITRARYNTRTGLFTGTTLLLVKLAVQAIQHLGWKVENVNESVGIVTFETGVSWGSWSGVSCSLSIQEMGENTFRVIGTGKQNIRGGQLAALDFGEAKKRADKAIAKMAQLAQMAPLAR